jgi:hypothetical protein
MKPKFFLPFFLTFLFTVINVFATPQEARQEVDKMARVFMDYGWDFRDYYTYGTLYEGESSTYTSTFYAGNQYILLAGGCNSAEDVDLYLYDGYGDLVRQDKNADQYAAVSFTCAVSGTFTIRVKMYRAVSPSVAVHWALRYGYK